MSAVLEPIVDYPLMKVASITPYARNAKKHSDDQIEKIAASIQRFGFNQPIVVDASGTIIIGHGRFFAAQKMKLDEVPVLIRDLPEAEAMAYRLADNKLN